MDEIFSVKFKGVKNNILNALTFLYKKDLDKQENSETYQKERVNSWKDKLNNSYNQQIINDGFWLIVLKKNRNKFFAAQHSKAVIPSRITERNAVSRSSNNNVTANSRATNPFRLSTKQGSVNRQQTLKSKNLLTKGDSVVKSSKFNSKFGGKYDSEQFFDEMELQELYHNIENSILDRMAENYIEFMIGSDGKEKELFFQVKLKTFIFLVIKLLQIYFDLVAQGVFYSFFYAFPKSRLKFDDEYKKFVFHVFAELFTGLKITYKSQFIKGWAFVTNWKLDLGAGDVLQQSKNKF